MRSLYILIKDYFQIVSFMFIAKIQKSFLSKELSK